MILKVKLLLQQGSRLHFGHTRYTNLKGNSLLRALNVGTFIVSGYALSEDSHCKVLISLIVKRQTIMGRCNKLGLLLGEQLRHLHLLPHPALNISSFSNIEHELISPDTDGSTATVFNKSITDGSIEHVVIQLTRVSICFIEFHCSSSGF
ncbi:hypothetical protein RIF29_29317 [Crotalaria pallida]|uniref:Uncharacterized protein n=1 Tax=Crotalaria pallida TaxID=3830 RepID=A0AAN9EGI1_CROPI